MKTKKVTVIDYGMGNIWSVVSAFKYLGAEVESTAEPEEILKSNILILPGVGSFRKGMEMLTNRGIDEAIIDAVKNKGARILGICLGMHLMGAYGTEDGGTIGLGFLPNKVDVFSLNELGNNKVPHVGFNSVYSNKREGLFKGLSNLSDFYFTHSYRMLVDDFQGKYATCEHGVEFMAAFQIDNVCGVQFHPEKSQANGLILLSNFLQE